MELLPLWYWYGVSFIFGVIIGSFLNVYLYRFHTGRSLGGSSHCLSCQHPLAWYELLPLLSYTWLLGSCRHCGAYIPPRYFLVELLTGGLFVLTVWQVGLSPVLPLLLAVQVMLVLVAVYDLYHYIIPNEFVVALLALATIILGYNYYAQADIVTVGYTIVTAVGASAFLAALWGYSRGRWIGFGDVKLVFPLALIVGWQASFSLVVLSFWVGAVISLGLLGLQYINSRGQLRLPFLARHFTIKSEVPFAPFLILSFLLVYYFGVDVVALLFYAV